MQSKIATKGMAHVLEILLEKSEETFSDRMKIG